MQRQVQINTIEGFEDIQDYYYVTPGGQVFGARGKLKPGRTGPNREYEFVILRTKEGKSRNVRVHRLVACAFIPTSEIAQLEVIHKNGNKSNNEVSNLAYKTRQEVIDDNVSHTIVGTCTKTKKEVRFKSMAEAERNGFHAGNICDCVNGRQKTHKSFTWRREEEEDN